MAKCQICSKGPQFGNRRSHAMNATRRIFKPNLVKRSYKDASGAVKRIYMCARCTKTLAKYGKTLSQKLHAGTAN